MPSHETSVRDGFEKWKSVTNFDAHTKETLCFWAYAAGMARMRWIRVSEQLPELDKAVLCYGQGVYWVAHLRGHFVPRDRMQWEYGGEMVPVDAFTHWAELAAPGAEGDTK